MTKLRLVIEPNVPYGIGGVYEIVCLEDGTRYIGGSVNIRHRVQGHRSGLRKGQHCNTTLQKSWNKYGEETFRFRVVEVCSRETLVEREQYYIDSQACCNIFRHATLGPRSIPRWTDERKVKQRERMLGNQQTKGIRYSPEQRSRMGKRGHKL